jgi:hypothetical protein
MNEKIDAFVEQFRKSPKFVAASAIDPKWTEQLAAVERQLNAIDRKADDDPATLEILDKVLAVIARGDLSLTERLLQVGELFVQFRDRNRTVN